MNYKHLWHFHPLSSRFTDYFAHKESTWTSTSRI